MITSCLHYASPFSSNVGSYHSHSQRSCYQEVFKSFVVNVAELRDTELLMFFNGILQGTNLHSPNLTPYLPTMNHTNFVVST